MDPVLLIALKNQAVNAMRSVLVDLSKADCFKCLHIAHNNAKITRNSRSESMVAIISLGKNMSFPSEKTLC